MFCQVKSTKHDEYFLLPDAFPKEGLGVFTFDTTKLDPNRCYLIYPSGGSHVEKIAALAAKKAFKENAQLEGFTEQLIYPWEVEFFMASWPLNEQAVCERAAKQYGLELEHAFRKVVFRKNRLKIQVQFLSDEHLLFVVPDPRWTKKKVEKTVLQLLS